MIDDKVFREKVTSLKIKYLYEQTVQIIAFNVILISLVNFMLWPKLTAHDLLFSWSVISILTIIRYFQAKRVVRHRLWEKPSYAKKLIYTFMVLAFIAGSLWAIIFLVYARRLDIVGDFFMLLMLGGIAASTLVPHSSVIRAYLSHTLPMLIPPIIFFAVQFSWENMMVAAVCTLYLMVLITTLYRSNRITSHSICLQIEKDRLISTLSEKNKRINALLQVDELTQIPNRRFLFETLGKELHRAQRENANITLFMIDIDCFKSYNDNYGHVKGDKVLYDMAQILKHTLQRSGDFIARYGGEEFVAILPSSDKKSAAQMAERILQNTTEENIEHKYSTVKPYLTVSIGCFTIKAKDVGSADELITKADNALYEAKRQGRNRYIQS